MCNKSEHAWCQSSLQRRDLLRAAALGLTGVYCNGLIGGAMAVADDPLTPKPTHFPARADTIIYLSMEGGPSHVDTFDYKPELQKRDGQSATKVGGGTPSREARKGNLWASPWKFSQHGQSGLHISELFPHLAKHADKLCLLNGMYTDTSAHALAQQTQFTGSFQFARPSLGSWVMYGLGSTAVDVPGYISLRQREYGSAFLPGYYQHTHLDLNRGVDNIGNTRINREEQLEQLEQLAKHDRILASDIPAFEEITRGQKANYEMAYKMQSSMTALLDMEDADEREIQAYGIDQPETKSFGMQCLLARRLVEKGVRFVQLQHGGWDQHFSLVDNLGTRCAATDRPIAALLEDLDQRGMLERTLVIWGGEFGRTPFSEDWTSGRAKGRDHNAVGYTVWMAGGGVKGGMRYGSTDELGSTAVQGRMHLHDLHATVLHLMGLDHEKLTYRYGGRDFRLTDVHGHVAKEIFA